MGRELRRVPLDFDWPLNEVWQGYLSPKWRPCPNPECVNGETTDAAWLGALTHLILMLGEEGQARGDRPLHPWLQSVALAPKRRPTARMAEVTGGLSGRPPREWGHDACDRWAATKAILKAAGLSEDWGTCPTCKGHAIHPGDIAASEAWEPTEPPTGDGYQLWETTSEGSPQTPVFATLDELCAYAAGHCTTFASDRASAEGWKHMLTDGMVASVRPMGNGTALFI